MTAVESINAFVDVMLGSKTKFHDIKAETDRRSEALRECISRFRSGIDSIVSKGVNVSDSELKEISQRQISELKTLLERVAASLESTRKGMKFIREYEDSFNIAVFGKVKAGKSYTGNFIMGNVIRDMGIATSYDRVERPKVEVYDRGRKSTQSRLAEFDEEGREGFRVDPNEATSTIQLFRLGAMVWIDTPGIGSVTWENEMLAKDYVDNADLIVYMSNSDAAGTKQDFKEMKELHDKGKRFLLLLTQSDTVKETVKDRKIVSVLAPKSDEDRQSMEDYICDTLIKEGITELDRGREILTISTKLALEALKNNDEAMFDASNLKRFLEVLVSITQTDAAKLKLATPAQRINAAINEIEKGFREANRALEEHMSSLAAARMRLSEHNEYLQSKMLNECMTGITELVSKKAQEIESGGSGVSASVLQDIIGSEIYRVIMKTCAEEFSGSEAMLSSYSDSLKVEGIKDMAMRHDTITYTRREVDYVERDPHGLWEYAGHYLLGKTYYRTKTRNVTETRNVDLGVNLQEVLSDVRAGIDSLFIERVPEIMKSIADSFIAPVAQVRENARREIESAVRELESLKIKI